jgi:predicted DNA-binding transcriptional regulator AlpA
VAETPNTLAPDAERVLDVRAVSAMTSLSRATLYRLPFFRQRKVRLSPNRVGWCASDVRLFLTLNREGRAA